MSENKKYSDKLKDPRWQKMRLKILERDGWMCQECKEDNETLMVHHYFYDRRLEPWDYDESNLITLCESCHKYEHESRYSFEKMLLNRLKAKHFLSDDIGKLTMAISNMDMASGTIEDCLLAIEWAIQNHKNKGRF